MLRGHRKVSREIGRRSREAPPTSFWGDTEFSKALHEEGSPGREELSVRLINKRSKVRGSVVLYGVVFTARAIVLKVSISTLTSKHGVEEAYGEVPMVRETHENEAIPKTAPRL
eukprot:CAMPEP_0180547796 /NCGR_PEP_ID=MMETSP1036_2-20121128/71277_1 /TAXON_ID=632150 /ORGANISM="Azadinium spinosum, Strain 3D9" /LENGTH=113 /DNA_ID=CAMNT_0022562955 /DNA_START=376 /DNA_END=717 /DNA_ORIENTATION=-